MSTTTANLGFIKPELTDAADITKYNQNWDKLDQKLNKVVVEETLIHSNWGSQNTYRFSNQNIISATQTIELLPSPKITVEQLDALQMANIVGVSQEVGSVNLKAFGEVPVIDIPVVFIIRGDV